MPSWVVFRHVLSCVFLCQYSNSFIVISCHVLNIIPVFTFLSDLLVFQSRIDRFNLGDWVFHSRRVVALIGTNGESQNIFLLHNIRLEIALFKNKYNGENITLQHAYQMCTLCHLVYAVLHIIIIIIIIVHLWCAYYKKDIGALQSQRWVKSMNKRLTNIKCWTEKWVLRCFRKTAEFGSVRMLSGREFHADGLACEKARSPNLDRSCGS